VRRALAAPCVGAADELPRLRVLIYSGLNNHDWRSNHAADQEDARGCGALRGGGRDRGSGGVDAATLARYDVIVSNWTP